MNWAIACDGVNRTEEENRLSDFLSNVSVRVSEANGSGNEDFPFLHQRQEEKKQL